MIFLQDITIPIHVDTIKHVTENLIEEMQNNPHFWQDMGHSALKFGIKVTVALVIYIAGAWLIKKLRNLIVKLMTKRGAETTLVSFISSFISISLTLLLIITTVSTLGVDTTSFAALLAAGGMALGMALSGTVQNFAGGIMLLLFKPFKAGDYISAQGFAGKVSEITITSTKIVTVDNRVIVLPNGALSNGTIDNYSQRPVRRLEWQISVEYGSDSQKCIEYMRQILDEDPRVLHLSEENVAPVADPAVMLLSLNSNDITFVARVWVKTVDYWDVFFKYNQRFYEELPKQGFGFAYPHMDVTIKQNEKNI